MWGCGVREGKKSQYDCLRGVPVCEGVGSGRRRKVSMTVSKGRTCCTVIKSILYTGMFKLKCNVGRNQTHRHKTGDQMI